MPKIRWTRAEIQTLIDNYSNKTTQELEELFPRHTRKSIERQIEKLRKEGKIGYRNRRTRKRAYRQRIHGQKQRSIEGGIRSAKFDYDYEDIDDEDADYEYEEVDEDSGIYDYEYEEVDDPRHYEDE